MACPNEETIQSFLDGAMSPADRAELGRHADECEDCHRLAQLAVARAHITIGTVLAESHDVAGAIEANMTAVRILERVLQMRPSDKEARIQLARAQAELGHDEKALGEDRATPEAQRAGHLRAARTWYAKSLEGLAVLRAEGSLDAFDEEWAASVPGLIADCDRELAKN